MVLTQDHRVYPFIMMTLEAISYMAPRRQMGCWILPLAKNGRGEKSKYEQAMECPKKCSLEFVVKLTAIDLFRRQLMILMSSYQHKVQYAFV